MPVYDHVCSCGQTITEYRPLSAWDHLPLCPVCGTPMPQQFGPRAIRATYARPIRLESMGFLADPEDVAEHRRRFPEIDLEFHEGSAIPVVRSLGQKRRYLKAAGWADVKSFT